MTPIADWRRVHLREELRSAFEDTLDDRISRWIDINHQPIVGAHHFAAASTECLELYRDGFFVSAVMTSQAVAEGIRRFVLDRNSIAQVGDGTAQIQTLLHHHVLSPACAEAFDRIRGSFRNDVHHMNPKVAQIPFRELAKQNAEDLCLIEREVFEHRVDDGKLFPVQPRYWDLNADGTVNVFLRLQ